MNTKFVMPRLANAIGSKAKASFAAIKTYSGELHSVELGTCYSGFVRLRLRRRDKGASCRIQRLPLSAVAKCNSFASLDKGVKRRPPRSYRLNGLTRRSPALRVGPTTYLLGAMGIWGRHWATTRRPIRFFSNNGDPRFLGFLGCARLRSGA